MNFETKYLKLSDSHSIAYLDIDRLNAESSEKIDAAIIGALDGLPTDVHLLVVLGEETTLARVGPTVIAIPAIVLAMKPSDFGRLGILGVRDFVAGVLSQRRSMFRSADPAGEPSADELEELRRFFYYGDTHD